MKKKNVELTADVVINRIIKKKIGCLRDKKKSRQEKKKSNSQLTLLSIGQLYKNNRVLARQKKSKTKIVELTADIVINRIILQKNRVLARQKIIETKIKKNVKLTADVVINRINI